MSRTSDKIKVGALLLIAGGLVGAGLATMYAPQSGEKTRRQINRFARRIRNDTEAMIRDAAETVSEAMDDLGDKTTDLVEKGGEVAEDWRRHLLDAIDRGQKELDRQRKKLVQYWG